MSRALRRSIAKANQAQRDYAEQTLEGGAAKRQTIAPDDLMVIGGQKYDLSKSYASAVQEMLDKGQAVNPDQIIPKYVTANGKVYDTDTGEEVSMRDTVVIDNRVLSVGDFGGDALGMVAEMYEQFLCACQQGQKSEFRKLDQGHTAEIIDHVKSQDARQMLQEKLDPHTLETYWVVDWSDPHVTFEGWMEWVAATLRWRLNTDLKRRYDREVDIQKRSTMTTSRDILDPFLIAVEKFLALPEKKRLTAV